MIIVGATKAACIMKFEEYADVTVFVPESVNTMLASSGLLEVFGEYFVWKV